MHTATGNQATAAQSVQRRSMRAAGGGLLLLLVACGSGGGGAPRVLAVAGPSSYVGGIPFVMAAGYVDVDAHLDLVVGHTLRARVDVLLGHGDGTFTAVAPVTFGFEESANQVVLGFFDFDPFLDLAVLETGERTLHVFLGRGNGLFLPALGSPTAFSSGAMKEMVGGAIDGDVYDDLVFTATDGLYVLLCDGDGSFTTTPASPMPLGNSPDGLGGPTPGGDLVVVDDVDGVAIPLIGDGLGGFAPGPAVAVGPQADQIALGANNTFFVSEDDAPALHVFQLAGGSLQPFGATPVSLAGVPVDLAVIPEALPGLGSTPERLVLSQPSLGSSDPRSVFEVFDVDSSGLGLPSTLVRPAGNAIFVGGVAGDFVEGDLRKDVAWADITAGTVQVFEPR